MKNTAYEKPAGKRLTTLDFLRGIAVILMIQQHLGVWLWDMDWQQLNENYAEHALILFFNALGGLAAPIFISLAGCGTVLLSMKYDDPVKRLVLRGLCIMAFGYILNLSVPSWFSPGSWYVLHMIGFAFVVSPLLLRIPDIGLYILTAVILAATILIQNYLDTAFLLDNAMMSDTSLPGGAFRLAIAEGHFPVFPWLAFFISGMCAGKFIVSGKQKKIFLFAGILFCIGIILSTIYILKPDFTRIPSLIRVFKPALRFYPAFSPITLVLMAAALFAIGLSASGEKRSISGTNAVVCLGRVSLTLLLFHVIFFRELGIRSGFHKLFSDYITLIIIALIICILSFLAYLWKKTDFIFSLEWIMRKISG